MRDRIDLHITRYFGDNQCPACKGWGKVMPIKTFHRLTQRASIDSVRTLDDDNCDLRKLQSCKDCNGTGQKKPSTYNDKMDADTQVTAEEEIAALLYPERFSEETAGEAGRIILRMILEKFRPDLFETT